MAWSGIKNGRLWGWRASYRRVEYVGINANSNETRLTKVLLIILPKEFINLVINLNRWNIFIKFYRPVLRGENRVFTYLGWVLLCSFLKSSTSYCIDKEVIFLPIQVLVPRRINPIFGPKLTDRLRFNPYITSTELERYQHGNWIWRGYSIALNLWWS